MSAMLAKHWGSYLCREVPGNVIKITFAAMRLKYLSMGRGYEIWGKVL